jgi:DNA-binding FadR family transcriptional regulator
MSRLHVGPMRELLAEMAVGELVPGDMLAREVDLATRFDVSRGVVREFIRGLEERGVIAVKHGRGATVTPSDEWDVLDPEVLRALLQAPGGEELVGEALECQRLLEVHAAGLAAERARPDDLDALAQAVERMAAEVPKAGRTAGAAERCHEADRDFHRALVRASGNRALARMSAPLHRALMAAAGERAGPVDVKRQLAAHRKIVSAIAEGDADAARAATAAHLGAGKRTRRRRTR